MDFREAIRKNNFKTKLVIGTYIVIMIIVGILADIVISPNPQLNFSQNFFNFITFKQVPSIMLVIFVITILGIFLITKFGHKMMLSGTGYTLLDPDKKLSIQDKQIYNIVEEMSLSANLGYIPKIYILETNELNAFAAGWNQKNTLVGITRGLLNALNRNEIQAVMAHEIGHIIHGDSKLTLYVGILANVIITFTNIFANVAYFIQGKNNDASNKARILLIILNLVLPIITQILYLYLSRTREYMADAAAVQLTGDNQAMISALQKISHSYTDHKKSDTESIGEHFRSAAYIFSKGDSVFSTHPSVENRIKKLNGN